jgi:hypothetical protein
MSVVVTIEVPSGTEQQYEHIVSRVFEDGTLPKGWLLHLAGPTETGWRVVNVVESQEEFETFARERLLPAVQEAGDPAPKVTFSAVHRLVQPQL